MAALNVTADVCNGIDRLSSLMDVFNTGDVLTKAFLDLQNNPTIPLHVRVLQFVRPFFTMSQMFDSPLRDFALSLIDLYHHCNEVDRCYSTALSKAVETISKCGQVVCRFLALNKNGPLYKEAKISVVMLLAVSQLNKYLSPARPKSPAIDQKLFDFSQRILSRKELIDQCWMKLKAKNISFNDLISCQAIDPCLYEDPTLSECICVLTKRPIRTPVKIMLNSKEYYCEFSAWQQWKDAKIIDGVPCFAFEARIIECPDSSRLKIIEAHLHEIGRTVELEGADRTNGNGYWLNACLRFIRSQAGMCMSLHERMVQIARYAFDEPSTLLSRTAALTSLGAGYCTDLIYRNALSLLLNALPESDRQEFQKYYGKMLDFNNNK